ncbi:hypothetical protein WT60_25885 [Burkholderia sp. MSMB617WGS]|nr:hypothetical protein WT60_25885 [Burkholderia sp. MSMB617WGS]KWZ47451.1 hypothetical protein WS73_02365 [Burkholderia savannae]
MAILFGDESLNLAGSILVFPCQGFSIHQRSIYHRVSFVSRSEIGIRVIYDDSQTILFGMEAMNLVTRQNEYLAGG